MTRPPLSSSVAGGSLTVVLGVLLLRLWIGGDYQRYVRTGMGPFLAAAGAVLVLLGVLAVVRAARALAADRDDAYHHGHSESAGWLLLAPMVVLVLVAPPSLGSFGVDRALPVTIKAGAEVFTPLPTSTSPHVMTLLEFEQRAADHDGATFAGAAVSLTGFVASADGVGFKLARYTIACCAADARPSVVRVVGTGGAPPARDQWVTVVGVPEQSEAYPPVIRATSIALVKEPVDPYE